MKAVLVNCKKYPSAVSDADKYAAARGDWYFNRQNPTGAEYALIYAYGEILQVYRIDSWENPSGDRWRFSGDVAEDGVKNKCVNINYRWQRGLGPAQIIDSLEEFMSENDSFAKAIKKVQRGHVEKAAGYIAKKGERGNYGIFYLRNPAQHLAVMYDGEKFAPKDLLRVAYHYATMASSDSEIEGEIAELPGQFRAPFHAQQARDFFTKMGFNIHDMREEAAIPNNENINLLMQFYQIILYGPPGTGKTWTAKNEILAGLFGADKWRKLQGKHWDIVQFHPSYNYEDFVRGVQVDTRNEKVVYETMNKTFGQMCKRAGEALERIGGDVDSAEKYALIIDEINRANVSAVLGELIYALEYRGKPVKTPYSVDGDQNITIPENLYIIGTMNTADRTIGQIDYAVRRRFAFKYCGPDRNVVKTEFPAALRVYDDVQALFRGNNPKISSDFDAADVEIGHSYFMAEGEKLARKIEYQVIPILREYIKDGVLKEGAKNAIDEIESSVGDKYYIVNVGVRPDGTTDMFRDWEYCRELGFLAAGGGDGHYSAPLRELKPGSKIFAYLNGKGYVGFGKVRAAALPVRGFKIGETPVLDYVLKDGESVRKKHPLLEKDADDESREWFIAVDWIKTKDGVRQDKSYRGKVVVFNPNKETIAILKEEFGI